MNVGAGAVIGLVLWLGLGVPSGASELPWRDDPSFRGPLAPPSGKALKALRPVSMGPANASFESVNGATGQPTDWSVFLGGAPVVVEGRGGPGTRAGRVGATTGYWQTFALDLPLQQTMTFAAWGRGSLGAEQLRFAMECYSPSVVFLGGVYPTRSEALPPGVWAPTYHDFSRTRADEVQLSFVVRTRADTDWVDVDDVAVLTEGFRDGSFAGVAASEPEAGWVLAGGATMDGGELSLPPGGSARQLVAESVRGKDYFLYLLSGARAEVHVTRRDSSGTALGEPMALQFSATGDGAGGEVASVPAGTGASVAEVEISASTASTVAEVSRGFVQAWPPRVIATANSPIPSTRLAAAWPGVLATASLALVDGEGEEVLALPLQQDRDSVWADFDGGTLPAGSYRARFRLANGAGTQSVMREAAFTIERPEPFSASPQPYVFEGGAYPRMPWIWLYPFTQEMAVESADEAEALLRPAKEDGFNFFLIITSANQFEVVKEGARRVGVPYVVYEPLITELYTNRGGLNNWHPDIYLEGMEPFLTFSGEPLFRGVYLRDEPNVQGTEGLDRVRRLVLLLERDGRYGTGFTFLSTNPVLTLEGADYPVFSTYHYPVRRLPLTNEQSFARYTPPPGRFSSYMQETEPDLARARALGKPFWAGVQGFGTSTDPVMSPAQASTQLGCTVAMGADGYFTFLYYTLNSLGGLRSLNGDPSPRIAVYRDFNARMERLWPLLKTLSPTRTAPPQTNVIARVTADPEGTPHAVVVNYEERPVAVEVETDAASTMRNVESLEGGTEGTTHTLTLAAGAWAVLRFEGGAPVRFTGVYAPPPAARIAAVRETGRLETGAAHTHLALSPSGENFATLTGDRFRLYTRAGTRLLNDYGTSGPGYVRFLGPSRLLTSSSRFGFRIYDLPTTNTATLALERLRFTGGALDVLPDPGDAKAWISMTYRGLGRANLTDSVTLTGFFPTENYDFQSLHGPFADGSVIAVEQTYGPYRFVEREDGSLEPRRFDTTQLYDFARSSPNGRRIVVGNADRGATVYDVDANGFPAGRVRIEDPALIQAEGTAWLADDTLAVTDLHRGIRFYRVLRDGWIALGVWKPAPEPFQIESMDANARGEVAVSLSNGQVVFADAKALVEGERADGWMLE